VNSTADFLDRPVDAEARNARPRCFGSDRGLNRRLRRARARRCKGGSTTARAACGKSGLFLNNRHYDPTVGVFVSVDPLVTKTMQPYVYGSANPNTYSDPMGLEPRPIHDRTGKSTAGLYADPYNSGCGGYGCGNAKPKVSPSDILLSEDPWQAWGIWREIGDTCPYCEGFNIDGGSGQACVGVSACAAAAMYILEATMGNPAAATSGQFANAKWIAANYCLVQSCGAGNQLALENYVNTLAASADIFLVGGPSTVRSVAKVTDTASSSTLRFRSGEWIRHWRKHGSEFGSITPNEYLRRARSLLDQDVGGDILGGVRANGDVWRFNAHTDDFAVRSADGIIRTFFKPRNGHGYL